MTGTPLGVRRRLQFNIFLHKVDKIDLMKEVPSALLPIFWINEGLDLGDKFVNDLNANLFRTLNILSGVQWTMMGGGLALAAGAALLHYKKRRGEESIYQLRTPTPPPPSTPQGVPLVPSTHYLNNRRSLRNQRILDKTGGHSCTDSIDIVNSRYNFIVYCIVEIDTSAKPPFDLDCLCFEVQLKQVLHDEVIRHPMHILYHTAKEDHLARRLPKRRPDPLSDLTSLSIRPPLQSTFNLETAANNLFLVAKLHRVDVRKAAVAVHTRYRQATSTSSVGLGSHTTSIIDIDTITTVLNSPGVVDNLVEGPEQFLLRQLVELQPEGVPIHLGLGGVGVVVAEDWHRDDRHRVPHRLEHAEQPTVSQEGAQLTVTLTKVGVQVCFVLL
uniref:Uncharacterized protein n=1 Tax=Timema tahoe TaxID=61484 RepID=A0A7R9FG78_9NEOP|nr:unnamed protein product [Timema tahoe]